MADNLIDQKLAANMARNFDRKLLPSGSRFSRVR
jgi:hypothetical protein